MVQNSDDHYTTLANLSRTCSLCYNLLEYELKLQCLKQVERRFPTLEIGLYRPDSRPKDMRLEIHGKLSLDYRERKSGAELRKALVDSIGKFSNLRGLNMDCDNHGITTSCWSEIVVQLPKLTALRVSYNYNALYSRES